MNGFTVNTQTLRACGNDVARQTQVANDIKNQCANAQVPDNAWGALGMLTTHRSYTGLLQKFQDHVDTIDRAIGKAADDIKAAADSYEEVDRDNANRLKQVGVEMSRLTREVFEELTDSARDIEAALRDVSESEHRTRRRG